VFEFFSSLGAVNKLTAMLKATATRPTRAASRACRPPPAEGNERKQTCDRDVLRFCEGEQYGPERPAGDQGPGRAAADAPLYGLRHQQEAEQEGRGLGVKRIPIRDVADVGEHAHGGDPEHGPRAQTAGDEKKSGEHREEGQGMDEADHSNIERVVFRDQFVQKEARFYEQILGRDLFPIRETEVFIGNILGRNIGVKTVGLKSGAEAEASDHAAEIALIGKSNYGGKKKLARENSRGGKKQNGEESPLPDHAPQ
jgi:hypothetical protein